MNLKQNKIFGLDFIFEFQEVQRAFFLIYEGMNSVMSLVFSQAVYKLLLHSKQNLKQIRRMSEINNCKERKFPIVPSVYIYIYIYRERERVIFF